MKGKSVKAWYLPKNAPKDGQIILALLEDYDWPMLIRWVEDLPMCDQFGEPILHSDWCFVEEGFDSEVGEILGWMPIPQGEFFTKNQCVREKK